MRRSPARPSSWTELSVGCCRTEAASSARPLTFLDTTIPIEVYSGQEEDTHDDEMRSGGTERATHVVVNPVSGKSGMHKTALSALAEPNRMRIVELLRDGPLTVGEIAERVGLRQPQTSKHLKVLSDKGIVAVQVDANRRIYRLRAEPFCALEAWLHSFERIMRERFDHLDDYLRELQDDQQDQNE